MNQSTQIEAPSCSATRVKMDRDTLVEIVHVCDLPPAHQGGHEGPNQYGQRLGWASSRDDRTARVGS